MNERKGKRPGRCEVSRREVLRRIGMVAGAAALSPGLKACGGGGDDLGSPTTTPTPAPAPLQRNEIDIGTVVIVMMENRSFDHYYGARSLEEGRAVDGLRSGMSNPRLDGTPVPIFHSDLHCVADPPHGWDASHRQVNDGHMDGFVREHEKNEGSPVGDQVMGYYNRGNIPFIYALADEFVLCERWFCAVRGPTWPNRMYLHAAQSGGRKNNDFLLPSGLKFPTIYERLNAAGVDWRYYYTDLPFLALFAGLKGFTHFAPIMRFAADAQAGTLPPVCVVEPGFGLNDDHPPHNTRLGQAFLSMVVHALGQSPQWARSMFILTYDEHGGFFDHVPPPTVDDERSSEGFGALGMRVPSVIVSPYSPRGFVSPTVYEHSSWPAWLEYLHDLEPLTMRDANANIFLDAFDVDRVRRRDPRTFPSLPVIDIDTIAPPDCVPFVGGTASAQDIERLADRGGIPRHLDLRDQRADTFRAINRELQRMGVARPR